jgi:O-antigen/teichoic acid export membrane protein
MLNQVRLKFHFSHFIKYLFFSTSNAIISVCTIILLASYLSPEEFGKFGILMTIVYFTPSLISFSIDSLQAINIIELDNFSYVKFRNNYITFVFFIFIILIFFSIFFLYNLFYFKLYISSLIIGFLQTLSSIHNNELLQKKYSTTYGLLNIFNSTLLLLLSFIFLYISKTWEFRAIAIITTELCFVIVRLYFFSDILNKFNFSFDTTKFYNFFLFGYPLLLAVVPGWILNQLDKYIILNKYNFKIVGYYTFAASISGIIVLISQSLQKSIRPVIYNELYMNGNISKYRNKILKYSISIILISIFIGIFIIIFFKSFPNLKYSQTSYLISFALVSQAFFSIYSLYVMILEFYKKNNVKSRIIWESALLFLLINIFITKSFYIPALATLISFIYLSTKTYKSVEKYI